MNAYTDVQLEVKKYKLNFDFLETDGFKCSESILFHTDQNKVRLDSKNITVESILLNGSALKFNIDDEKRFLDVELPDSGEHEIFINYKAKFNKGLAGMYIAGKGSREMITTDFEPDSASFAFPCFDRPDKKATFSISAKIKDGHEAISNMPVESTSSIEGGKVITFMETPKMSTYLVYLGVGKFITKTVKHGKCHITLAVPGEDMRSDDFPLEVASKCVDFYENYFGIPYQLPKMHIIAVPDFAAGAMENWGAITFREDALLHNENTDMSTTRSIAITIAHEIAHQWFGNLVTMEWWNDLWLNESFATFMSSLCINEKYPEFEEVKTYYMDETVSSMKLDCLQSTHPINVDVKTPEEIKEIFDEISYGKGGSILRMIYTYVGDESFRNGLKAYLTEFKFGNARGADLWTHIAKVSGLPVDEIMDSWINQPGFPIINGTYDGKTLKLSQSRFLVGNNSEERLWKIPVFFRTENEEKSLLFQEKNAEFEIENLKGLNSNGAGYYLWRIEGENKALNKGLTSLNQADLINNAYFSFLSGELNFKSYTDLCLSICEEGDTPATTLCIRNTLFMESIVGDSDAFRTFASNLCRILVNSYESEDNQRPLEIITRNELEKLRALTDNDFAEAQAKLFKNYFLLNPNERNVVAVSKGLTSEDIDEMTETYRNASDDSDKYNIIEGMTRAPGKKNHKIVMSMVEDSEIKQQDVPYAFLGLIRNRDAKKFVFSNFETIVQMIETAFGESGILSRVVSVCIPYLGIENEKKIMRKVETIDPRKIGMGLKKGKELLETFKRIRTYVGQ